MENRKMRWGFLLGSIIYLVCVVWGGVWLVNNSIKLLPWRQYFNSAMIYIDNMEDFQFILILLVLILGIRVFELELKIRSIFKTITLLRRN